MFTVKLRSTNAKDDPLIDIMAQLGRRDDRQMPEHLHLAIPSLGTWADVAVVLAEAHAQAVEKALRDIRARERGERSSVD